MNILNNYYSSNITIVWIIDKIWTVQFLLVTICQSLPDGTAFDFIRMPPVNRDRNVKQHLN